MSSSPPRRRFLPEVVETSTKRSSKRPAEDAEPVHGLHQTNHPSKDPIHPPAPRDHMAPNSTPRRFLPQPIEESARSSRKFRPEPTETSSRSRRNADHQENLSENEKDNVKREPSPPKEDSDPKPARRFAPQPVETTSRSSRKFAPEPVETSKRTRRARPDGENPDSTSKSPKKKFLPEPIESTSRSRRGKRASDGDEKLDKTISGQRTAARSESDLTLSPRKFSPELLETARGSYRRGQAPKPLAEKPSAIPPPSTVPPTSSDREEASDIHESRFSAAALAKRVHPERQRSYLVPDLPLIESDSNEEDSDVPSLSASASDSSEDSLEQRHSIGGGQGIGQAAVDRELREQAMAAYINEKIHEPVDHFAIDRDEEDSSVYGRMSGDNGIDIRTFRRDSAVDLDWELRQMRMHHSQLEELKKELRENTAGGSRFSAAALASRQARGKKKGAGEKGEGFTEMRNAASPPMLGDDLVFPMSISPKMTRLTPDQVPIPGGAKREEEAVQGSGGDPQLWCANINVSNQSGAGLWMGLCHKGEHGVCSPPTPLRSGIMTPAGEGDHLHGTATPRKVHGRFGHGIGFLPLTPPRTTHDIFTESLDRKLNFEQGIEMEFHNGVVTQVYNYLSLGYPSLAHKFDEELSKISRISVEELRRDDELADAKGYVGAPEGNGVAEDGVTDGKCARWAALRMYLREWGRQNPAMADKERNDWGVRARRGSWAF